MSATYNHFNEKFTLFGMVSVLTVQCLVAVDQLKVSQRHNVYCILTVNHKISEKKLETWSGLPHGPKNNDVF